MINSGLKPGKSGGGSLGQIIGTGVGAVAGAIVGGPSGAATGASLGGTLGGVGAGLAAPGTSPTPVGGPMERRLSQSSFAPEIEKPSAVLEKSLAALGQAPPEVQQAYADPLQEAYKRSLYKDFRSIG